MKKYIVDILIFIVCFGVVYYINKPETKEKQPDKPKVTEPQGNPNPQGAVNPQGSTNPQGSQNIEQSQIVVEQPKLETVRQETKVECKNGVCTPVQYYNTPNKSPALKYYVDRRGRMIYFYQ